jgi:hypothetical protein
VPMAALAVMVPTTAAARCDIAAAAATAVTVAVCDLAAASQGHEKCDAVHGVSSN